MISIRRNYIVYAVLLLLTSCSSGAADGAKKEANNDEAIRKTSYYENVSDYWDTFSIGWKSDVCVLVSGPEDTEGLEKAINVMKLLLKANVGVKEIDIEKTDDGYSKALRLFLAEKCIA